jgi:hypothetical protein
MRDLYKSSARAVLHKGTVSKVCIRDMKGVARDATFLQPQMCYLAMSYPLFEQHCQTPLRQAFFANKAPVDTCAIQCAYKRLHRGIAPVFKRKPLMTDGKIYGSGRCNVDSMQEDKKYIHQEWSHSVFASNPT